MDARRTASPVSAGEDPRTIGDRHRVAVLRLAQLAPSFEPLKHFMQTQQPISLPPTNESETAC